MARLDPVVSTQHFAAHQKEVLHQFLEKKLGRIERMCHRFKEGRVSLEVNAVFRATKERYEVGWRLEVPRDSLNVRVEAAELGLALAQCQEKMERELEHYRERIDVHHHQRQRATDLEVTARPIAVEGVD